MQLVLCYYKTGSRRSCRFKSQEPSTFLYCRVTAFVIPKLECRFFFCSLLFSSLLFSSLLFSSLLFSFYSILFYSILFYSSLCPSTSGSLPPSESSIFLCSSLSLSIPLTVAPQCHLSNDVLVFQLILHPLSLPLCF